MGKYLTQKEFIIKANKVHNNKYDYSKSIYINSYSKIKIICPIHGIFEQRCNAHLNGRGCSKCGKISSVKNRTWTTKEFIIKADKIHNSKYDYSLVNYTTIHKKVKIICPVHGIFSQDPHTHLKGCGCPKCSNNFSKGEKEVLEYIKFVYTGKINENNKKIIKPYELDIYLPELKLAIEYNGEYWHNKREQEKPGYHQLKEKLCQQRDITLINVWENDWLNNKDKIKELILLKLSSR